MRHALPLLLLATLLPLAAAADPFPVTPDEYGYDSPQDQDLASLDEGARDAYLLQFSWDNRADTFIGIGQLGLHTNLAWDYFGLLQFSIWANKCDGFVGLVQIAGSNYAGEFYGAAQIGAWNVEQEQFVGLFQLGAYNDARRELYALFQLGAYNEVRKAFVGLFQIGVVNHTRDGDILGVSQIGLFNVVDYDIYAFIGMIGAVNGVDNKFWGPFQIGIYNYANRFAGGAQVGVFNHVYDEISLMQAGAVNFANKIEGVQIGIFNHAGRLRGVQLGLINMTRKGGLPFMMLGNIGI